MIDSTGLGKRRAYILATVVYEYIATAEPVGSHSLTQKYNLGVSSATVRNEMAELEAGGYLVQPHTSAGRDPSDAGYRTYVDQLMQPEELTDDERRRIHDELCDATPRARRDHRQHDAAARAALEQPGLRDEAAARGAALQAHPADLALAAHRRRRRRDVARRRRAEPVRTRRRGAARRSHAVLERAQRAPRQPSAARRHRERRSRRRRAKRASPTTCAAPSSRRSSRRARANSRRSPRPARRTCWISPSFRTCASCVRSCASSRSRRRSIRSWRTP